MAEKFQFKKEDLPCAHHTQESQSHPYGMGSATETWWECAASDNFPEDYEFDELKCNSSCPCYAPVEVRICEKHGEYIDSCAGCEYDQYEEEKKLAEDYWKSEGRG